MKLNYDDRVNIVMFLLITLIVFLFHSCDVHALTMSNSNFQFFCYRQDGKSLTCPNSFSSVSAYNKTYRGYSVPYGTENYVEIRADGLGEYQGGSASFSIFAGFSDSINVSIGSSPCSVSKALYNYDVVCENITLAYNSRFQVFISPIIRPSSSSQTAGFVGITDFTIVKSTESLIQQQIQEDRNNSQAEINNANKNHQETMDTLTDSSVDSEQIGSLGGNLPGTNGVLSSILNLPILFFSNLLNSLSTTACPNLTIPIPFVDTNATIPCFRSILSDLGALTWFEGIGGLVGGLLIFSYIIHMGKTFNKMSDLDDTNNESWGGL